MRLYLLQMALVPTSGIPAVSYLIQTDDGTHVLVDSGLPRGHAAPEMGLYLSEGDHIVAQLAVLGLTPQDIRYLVCTHFDHDHAGSQARSLAICPVAQWMRGSRTALSSPRR